MPSKVRKLECDVGKLPSIPKELVNQFLTGPMTEQAINAAGRYAASPRWTSGGAAPSLYY